MPSSSENRGRFAPSPTGPLHFGSLVAAVGSYLDAKHHHGTWLVRMEDLDTPRCLLGAAADILCTLEVFGLHSDEPVLYQSQRTSAYDEALHKLQAGGAVYPCCCTRKEIADSALHGIDGLVYPGTCRNGIPAWREGQAWRVRTYCSSGENPLPYPCKGMARDGLEKLGGHDSTLPLSMQGGRDVGANESFEIIEFNDTLQGHISQNLKHDIGDFVIKRADGLFAYQLAVVVDDAFQNITHIVRGADLLASTPRQIHLQHLLQLPTPNYMHLPVAVNEAGEKLSKQTLAAPVNASRPTATLLHVLNFLRQAPPANLTGCDVKTILNWAIEHWDTTPLHGVRSSPPCSSE